MAFPIDVTFRNVAHSDALEHYVRDRAAELEAFSSDILGCRVVVAWPHHRRPLGNQFHIRVEVMMPGEQVVISRVPSSHGALRDIEEPVHSKQSEADPVHRYAEVAVHDAFDAARRKVQDHARRLRRDVKTHAAH